MLASKYFSARLISRGGPWVAVGIEGGGPAIVVNTNTKITVERWIFTVAHELGSALALRFLQGE